MTIKCDMEPHVHYVYVYRYVWHLSGLSCDNKFAKLTGSYF